MSPEDWINNINAADSSARVLEMWSQLTREVSDINVLMEIHKGCSKILVASLKAPEDNV